ncbi:Arabinanase/levansucrase/invertase [Ceraceosorus guamensis]|uniref:Arabinanase/levansucrase/invertase n=1 Tax=Ceraceosorus guamensis TaxID=1522189 RepID=A0A316VU89_9BASI|nr:Arabinanase/levansucrase/invertase [Ceraceosorus guamensis]PWN41000.1 Arabinanase/levansucrase/invertase [Ceraceosorus guamensis]
MTGATGSEAELLPISSAASAFQKFRPTSHFLAPRGWMNDPAGPTYDAQTGLHHLFYQWNPKGSTWGNMSWGHATSTSLAGPWKHDNAIDGANEHQAVLAPAAPYDCEGIFTGCVVPHGPNGEQGIMTALYTAVSALPIHFTRQYQRGCEKLAMATSLDEGKSWSRSPLSPILPGPPEGIDVLSWRDPFVSPWPEMDSLLSAEKPHYYGMIAGSVPNVGPRIFLYQIPMNDLSSWTFITTLGEYCVNASLPGMPWCGELGANWEVGMFFRLPHSDGSSRITQYLLLNVEGCKKAQPARHPMWVATTFVKDSVSGLPKMVAHASGLLDEGCAYAASAFHDAPTGRRMMWSWITEDDLPESYYDAQGWSGLMALPRELHQLELSNVIGALHSPLSAIGSIQSVPSNAVPGTCTVSTLGIRVAQEVERLRKGAQRRHESGVIRFDSANGTAFQLLDVASRSWELSTEVEVASGTAEVGLSIAHNQDRTKCTTVAFRPSEERLVVDRTRSTSASRGIKTAPIVSPLTLFTFSSTNGDITTEKLRLRIFCDNSVLEIFANDRLALATRIYPDDPSCVLLSAFARGPANFTNLDVWEGLASAF